MADANVSALQAQINRFYGVAIGSPISVDGAVGPQTSAALKSVLDYMATASGVTDADVMAQEAALSSDGGNTLDAGLISSSAGDVASLLQNYADANGLTVGATPSAGGSSASGGKGFVTSTFPKQAAAASLTTQLQNLPMWVKIGGGLVAALIVFTIGKNLLAKRAHSRAGTVGLFGFDLADVLRAARPEPRKTRSKVSAKKRRRRELPILDVPYVEVGTGKVRGDNFAAVRSALR